MIKLDLSGTGTASDHEITTCATEIFDRLTEFDSPKDAGAALLMAHWYVIKAVFPPEFRAEAIDAVNEMTKMLIEFVNEGWQ